MLKRILVIGASAACLVLPAAAESYVKGDGCGGTYVDRKSEMMAGNITGGTRYDCSAFARRAAEAQTTTRRSAAPRYSYTAPTSSTRTYTAPSQSYSSGTVTYSAPPHTTYSTAPHYVTTHPGTTSYSSGPFYSSGGYTVTTTPRTTYRSGTPHHPAGHSYRSGHTTTYTPGTRTYTTTPPTSQTGTKTYTTQPQNPYGTPRVTGNLANSFTTVSPPEPKEPFSFGKPETFVRTDPE